MTQYDLQKCWIATQDTTGFCRRRRAIYPCTQGDRSTHPLPAVLHGNQRLLARADAAPWSKEVRHGDRGPCDTGNQFDGNYNSEDGRVSVHAFLCQQMYKRQICPTSTFASYNFWFLATLKLKRALLSLLSFFTKCQICRFCIYYSPFLKILKNIRDKLFILGKIWYFMPYFMPRLELIFFYSIAPSLPPSPSSSHQRHGAQRPPSSASECTRSSPARPATPRPSAPHSAGSSSAPASPSPLPARSRLLLWVPRFPSHRASRFLGKTAQSCTLKGKSQPNKRVIAGARHLENKSSPARPSTETQPAVSQQPPRPWVEASDSND